MSAPVHAARDRHGIMHIQAANTRDLGYAQGYVMAHDRLPQMDILRRFGDGTLAELFGAFDQGAIETDLEMRMHQMKPIAEQAWATLKASSDPDDRGIVDLFTGFAAGVNAAAADIAADEIRLDPAITWYAPDKFREWTPVDSLVLGRFQSLSLSFTAPIEIKLTQIYQAARTRFDAAADTDPAAFARRGISADLMTIQPLGRDPTINGFPNVDVDTGSRADAGRPAASAKQSATATASAPASPRSRRARSAARQPVVPPSLLRNANDFFAPSLPQGPHAFMVPHAGSNNWVVGPSLAGGGKALLAGDQHLSLPNPSIFYPVHLTVPGQLDVFGQTFPGIPGIILGSNGKAAWTSTVVFHDVNDVYQEQIAPCPSGGGDCVMHNGAPVRIERRTEKITVGTLGAPLREIEATYEVVPHHGPIIPTVQNGMIVPRTADQALSVRYTGYEPTYEIRAVWKLAHARTVDEGFAALKDFSYGGQNWVMIDDQGNFGWTTNAKVPVRKPAAYTWRVDNPTGLAPFFILPGTGEGDWEGYLSTRYVPHAINPAQGFLATANSDPVGATFDNDPLNGTMVGGRPLYAGVTYAAGVRTERITERLRAAAAAGPVTLDQLAAIQHDRRSNVAFHLRAPVLTALGYVADATGAPPDIAPYLATLTTAQRDRLTDARSRLAAWTLDTPTGLGAGATATEKADAAATAIWNVFMHYFLESTLGDEFTAMGQSVWGLDDNFLVRVALAMLVDPDRLVRSETNVTQPILCDDMTVGGLDQSCAQKIIDSTLKALVKLDTLMASADPATWRWGNLHKLTLKPLFPEPRLELPAPGSAMAGGYPKPGDQFAVNRADCGYSDLDFKQDADGPAQRFLAETVPGKPIRMRLEHPGGTIFHRQSSHYSDLLEKTYLAESHVDVPFVLADILAAGEERWVFRKE